MRYLISLLFLFILSFSSYSQQMWINEIHYDNTGGDVDEFVEVVLEDTFVGALSDIDVIFYNGSNGTMIVPTLPRTLDTFDVGATSNGFTVYSRIVSSIQNGAPDGIALVNDGTVINFISYEGTMVASNGPAAGMTSVDILVFEPGAIGESLQLSGTGNQLQLFTWNAPAAHTRGLVNTNQTFLDVPATVVSTFPLTGTSAVDSTTPIEFTFSEPVNAVTTSFTVTCDAILQSHVFSANADMKNFTLTPDTDWPVTSNCVVNMIAANITDIEGNANALDGNGDGTGGDDFSFSFTVASDALAKVTSSTPSNQQVLVAVNDTVTVNFSENVTLNTTSSILLNCPGVVAFSGLPASNVSSVTLTPTTSFSQGDICTVTVVGDEIIDLDGDNDFLDGDEDGIAGGNYVFTFSVIEEIMEIYDIQGSGSASPIADNFIRTQGNVVTAVSASGFFMQSPEPGDADINTSDGLFVFSNETVAVGDIVNVRGQIVEFFNFTEMSFVSSVDIISSGNPLPTPIEFDANTPSQDPANPSCSIEFECYEGMLIHVANGVANGGSQAFGGDVNAEAEVTATGNRALREPGVEFSQTGDSQLPPFPTASYDPDVFDENPEIFELDADALGLPSIEINGGATFSATGVLAYQFNDYELWPKELTFTQRNFDPIRIPGQSEITIATQNMYRFFDDVDDPMIDDFDEDNTTTQVFTDRVVQSSLYFRTVMHSPDIIVLTEVENLNSVQAMADQLNIDDASLNYSAHLIDGNDFGGIDIGFLAKGTASNISITQLGADETLAFNPPPPPELPRKLHDRPPLLINALITKDGVIQEVNVLGVHMRSRSGITGSDRNRIRNKHFEQALSVANMVQALQSDTVPLVIIGDFNDFEFSDGYVDVVGEIKGVVDPVKNLLDSTDNGSGTSVVVPTLINAVDTLPSEEKYSFIFRGTIQALDHALINDVALMNLSETTFVRGNSEAPSKYNDDYSQVLGMSDHDGLLLYLDFESEVIFSNSFED
jgi:predicted extracellular nuclease